MMRKIGLAMLSLVAAVVMTVAGPAGMADAADAHSTTDIPMPGGAGYIACTTDYNYSSSRASVHPVKTYCTNRTNRTILWRDGQYCWTTSDGWPGCNPMTTSVYMNPSGTYTYYFPSTAGWSARGKAYVYLRFNWKFYDATGINAF